MAPAPGSFDELLVQTSQATLIKRLRSEAIPDALTDRQKERVRVLLGDYHPETLERCAWIDADGAPLGLESLDWPGQSDSHQKANAIVNNYSAYLAWQAEHLVIRTVGEGDVTEPDRGTLGQRGLFARQAIPKGTVIPFGGMVLVDPCDKQQDSRIRERADCDRYRISNHADRSIVEGMGMPMMMNTALAATSSRGGDRWRNNFSVERFEFLRKGRGEFWTLPFLRANRDIGAGEQLCFAYGTGNPRYFETRG